jgi:hypothetical protein
MNKRKKSAGKLALAGAAAVLLLGLSATASADRYGIRVTEGSGTHDIDKVDLGFIWDPDVTWWDTGNWHFSLVGEAHVAYWNAQHGRNIYEAGVTPIFRFIKNSGEIRPFIEAGVGVRLLSHPTISDSYTMSSAFQFSDTIGFGAQFGGHQQYQAGYRFQHMSNARIKEPNPGINFSELYLQYNF